VPVTLRWWLRGLATGLSVVLIAVATGSVRGQLEQTQQESRLLSDLALRRELLHSELERHRLLPAALAGDPELAAAVRLAGTARAELESRPQLAMLNQRLAQLAREDGSASLYLIRVDGVTVAASNHGTASSFVGSNYSFRPYFTDALQSGSGQYFARGTVSGVAGLYLSTRLADGRGVVVVKVEFTALEHTWQQQGDRSFVVNGSNTVLLASDPGLRFQSLPVAPPQGVLRRATATAQPDWTLVMERDVADVLWAARLNGSLLGGSVAGVLGIAFWAAMLLRQQRQRIRQRLEELVDARTAELREANDRLTAESTQRALSEQRVTRLRSDLVSLNRLAVLGQVSAGVAHEINQPLAAIRGYIDNARTFLARQQYVAVAGNLAEVTRLTERIALITQELRLLARKAPSAAERVSVDDAIDGARLLVDGVLRAHRVRLVRKPAHCGLFVTAHRVRLEQVLVNLLQNAVEALEGTPGGLITLSCTEAGRQVQISIQDNGPGVDESLVGELFTPFTTGKPLGLGLGLVICRDLLAEFGGTLQYRRNEPRGAIFTIELPQAMESV
jgi:two-component system, NtrC family, C4-dicarboxylate transport sensor histidine kinase DctB